MHFPNRPSAQNEDNRHRQSRMVKVLVRSTEIIAKGATLSMPDILGSCFESVNSVDIVMPQPIHHSSKLNQKPSLYPKQILILLQLNRDGSLPGICCCKGDWHSNSRLL